MAKPPGFDEWIKYANSVGKTPEERKRLRDDVYRRYGMKPPADRGGFAGIWDRNKKIIKPVAQVAATILAGGNPAAGAGVGALMEGLDRPGKSGVGFDVAAGARGGLQGYGVGQLTKYGMGKAGMLPTSSTATPTPTPSALEAAAPSPAGQPLDVMESRDWFGAASTPDATAAATAPVTPALTLEDLMKAQYTTPAATLPTTESSPMNTNMLSNLLSGAGDMAGDLKTYIANMKPEVLQGILQGGGAALGGYLNRGAEEQRLEFMREQQRLEQERANRLAQLLMPMAGAQGRMVGAQYGGYGAYGQQG